METIYKVTTEGDVEGRSIQIVGYAMGNENDILDYFADKKYYSLHIEPINVISITSVTTNNRRELLKRQKELETELSQIKEKLK